MRQLKPSRILENKPSGQVGSGEAQDVLKGQASGLLATPATPQQGEEGPHIEFSPCPTDMLPVPYVSPNTLSALAFHPPLLSSLHGLHSPCLLPLTPQPSQQQTALRVHKDLALW